MEYNAIQTEAGIVYGRDSLFLDKVDFSVYPLKLSLFGKINGSNILNNQEYREQFIEYTLSFESLVKIDCTLLDFYGGEKQLKSQFDEVTDSPLLNALGAEASHRHFIVATYDYVFEVVAKSYELIIRLPE